ncbi:MAG: HNH endonuclease [Hyphomicrobium sp.]|jgi:hypothetical protein
MSIKKKNKCSQKQLRQHLLYCPKTGVWTWLVARPHVKPGQQAGHICTSGHRQIMLFGQLYLAHVLAWFYMTGGWPRRDIDHADTCPDNNKWKNLRLASRSLNMANAKKYMNNTSGFKGVHRLKNSGLYQARIKHNKKDIYLGSYKSAKDAHTAYCAAAVRLKGAFARL